MDKKELIQEGIQEIGRDAFRIVAIMQGIFIVAAISSPFIWIWHSLGLAWKTGLTGIIGTIFMYFVHKSIYNTIKALVKDAIEKEEL